MDEIAVEAGVAKGTIYLYYRSKQAMYDAAFSAALDDLIAVTDARVQAAATPRDAVAAFVDARVRYFEDHPDHFRLYLTEVSRLMADRRPRRGAAFAATLAAQTQALEAVFSRAVAARTMRRVDAAAAAHAVFDTTRGLVSRRILSREHGDAARDVAFLVDFIWTGLAPDGPRQGRTA